MVTRVDFLYTFFWCSILLKVGLLSSMDQPTSYPMSRSAMENEYKQLLESREYSRLIADSGVIYYRWLLEDKIKSADLLADFLEQIKNSKEYKFVLKDLAFSIVNSGRLVKKNYNSTDANEHPSITLLKILVERGAELASYTKSSLLTGIGNITLLHDALTTSDENYELIEYLITQQSISIHSQTTNGLNLIQYVRQHNATRLKTIKKLLSKYAVQKGSSDSARGTTNGVAKAWSHSLETAALLRVGGDFPLCR